MSPAKKTATKKTTTRKTTRRKRGPAEPRGPEARESALDRTDEHVSALTERVEKARGSVLASYRDPYAGLPLVLGRSDRLPRCSHVPEKALVRQRRSRDQLSKSLGGQQSRRRQAGPSGQGRVKVLNRGRTCGHVGDQAACRASVIAVGLQAASR